MEQLRRNVSNFVETVIVEAVLFRFIFVLVDIALILRLNDSVF